MNQKWHSVQTAVNPDGNPAADPLQKSGLRKLLIFAVEFSKKACLSYTIVETVDFSNCDKVIAIWKY